MIFFLKNKEKKGNLPITELLGVIMSLIVLISIIFILVQLVKNPTNLDIAKSNANSIAEFVNNNLGEIDNIGRVCFNYLNLENLELVQDFDKKDYYIYIIKKDGVYVYDKEVYKKYNKIFDLSKPYYDEEKKQYISNINLLPQKEFEKKINNFYDFLSKKEYKYFVPFDYNKFNLKYEIYNNKVFDDAKNIFKGLFGFGKSSSYYYEGRVNLKDVLINEDSLFLLIPSNIEGFKIFGVSDITDINKKNSLIIISLNKLKTNKKEFYDDYRQYYDNSKLAISNQGDLIGLFSNDFYNYVKNNLCIFKDILNEENKYNNIEDYKEDLNFREYLYLDLDYNLNDKRIKEKYKFYFNDNNNLKCRLEKSNLFSNDFYVKVRFDNFLFGDIYLLYFNKNGDLIKIENSDLKEISLNKFIEDLKDFTDSFKYQNIYFNNFKDFILMFRRIYDVNDKIYLKFNCNSNIYLKSLNICNKEFSLGSKYFINLVDKINKDYKNLNKCEVFVNNLNVKDLKGLKENLNTNFLNNYFNLENYNLNIDIKKEKKDIFDFKESFYIKTNLFSNDYCSAYYIISESDRKICNKYYRINNKKFLRGSDLKYSNKESDFYNYFIYDDSNKNIYFYDDFMKDYVYFDISKILLINDNKILFNDKEVDLNYKQLKIEIEGLDKDFGVYYFEYNIDDENKLFGIISEDQYKKIKDVPKDYKYKN